MRFKALILFILVVFLLSNCKKDEPITQNFSRDTVITDNTVPPYDQTSTVIIDNFVNRLYIDLIGKEPSDIDRTAEVTYLKTNNLSTDAKDTVVNKAIIQYDYYYRFYDLTKSKLLEGVDSLTIAEFIFLFEYQKMIAETSGQTSTAQYYQLEIDRLNALQSADEDLYNGTITINDFFQKMIENYFYDEINMGSENFVKACFENLLFRFPTDAELADAVNMVDGEPSQLFLVSGNSKGDFVDIVTTGAHFYEGLVYEAYERFLSRTPTSIEMSDGTSTLKTNNKISNYHKQILKSKDYAGF